MEQRTLPETAPRHSPGRTRTQRAPRGLIVLALFLVTINMRAAILAVPPVLGPIRRQLHLSPSLEGLLVSLPVICFGVCAFAGPRVTRRLGIEVTLALAMALLTIGVVLRIELSPVALFLGTAIIGSSIGLCNVVIPALIKRDFADHVGLMTGLYITMMLGMGALAAGGTVPLIDATGIAWRWALAIWAGPALLAAISWSLLVRQGRQHTTAAVLPVQSVGGLWRDRLAWQVTLFMGLQSLTFYAVAAWLPTLLSDSGAKLATGGVLVALTSAMGIPSSLGVSMLAGRRHQSASVLFAVSMSALGLLGFVVSPASGALAWTLVFGVGQGASLGLALTFIGLRSPDSHHATQLAGMAQSFGYLLAAVGPLFLGDLHAVAHNWTFPMALVTAITLPQLACGLAAARPRFIGSSLSSGR